MGLFRKRRAFQEREVAGPDWNRISDYLDPDEERVDCCKGWSIAGDVDHPCAAYLTDRQILLDIRPDASLTGAETLSIPFPEVAKCQLGTSDLGSPRLVIVFDPVGNSDPDNIRAVGVDLRPEAAGRAFGEKVIAAVEGSGGT